MWWQTFLYSFKTHFFYKVLPTIDPAHSSHCLRGLGTAQRLSVLDSFPYIFFTLFVPVVDCTSCLSLWESRVKYYTYWLTDWLIHWFILAKRDYVTFGWWHDKSVRLSVCLSVCRLAETRARQHGPCWRVMETGHRSTRAVNSGSGNRAINN